MLGDLRYGLRQLRRNKLFSLAVILLLGVGIGANALIFSCVNAVLLKPLPVRDPGSLVLLRKMRQKQVRPDVFFDYRQYLSLAAHTDLFSGVVAEESPEDYNHESLFPLQSGTTTVLAHTQFVSPKYFSELGVGAAAGRLLAASDAETSGTIPIVLSYQFWRSQFGGDASVIGRTVRLKDHTFVVVGVIASEFHDLDIERAPDIRLPISAAPLLLGAEVGSPTDRLQFEIVVRLRPGVSRAAVAGAVLPELQAVGDADTRQWLATKQPAVPADELQRNLENEHDYWLDLLPVGRGVSQLRDQFSSALVLLMSAVGLLLLAVCANVAGLLLVRSEQRRREIAVRLSIGANRTRVVRQLLAENLLLAIPAAALALLLAFRLSPFLLRQLPVLRGLDLIVVPRVLAVAPDLRVVAFTIVLTLLTVLGFGVAPASRGTKLDLYNELKANARTSTRAFAGITAVAVQVGLSVVLLVAAALMLRTFNNLQHLDPGFDRQHVVEFTVDTATAGYSKSQATSFFRDFQDRVAALPGVSSVAYAELGIMRGIGIKATVAPNGVVLPKSTFLNSSGNYVTPSYFDTLGIPLLAGRNLTESDLTAKPQPVVVNSALAQQFFPDGDAIGRSLSYGVDGNKPPAYVIVGIVGTAKYRSFRELAPPTFYSPLDPAARDDASMLLYVRTYGDPHSVIGEARSVLAKIAPLVPLLEVETLEEEVQNSLWQERLLALFCAFFAGVALLLTATGLYALLAYSVARRQRELGIRIALGAQLTHVLETVGGRIALSVGIGLVAGLAAAALLVNLTRSFLFGVRPLDPLSFLLALAGIVLCGMLAALVPSFRAAHTDAAVALREE